MGDDDFAVFLKAGFVQVGVVVTVEKGVEVVNVPLRRRRVRLRSFRLAGPRAVGLFDRVGPASKTERNIPNARVRSVVDVPPLAGSDVPAVPREAEPVFRDGRICIKMFCDIAINLS